MGESWNLKELTEGHHQEWSLRLNLTKHGKSHQARTPERLTDWKLFLDSVGGSAWPFLVGGTVAVVSQPSSMHACMQCNARKSASKRHSASAYTHTQRSICNFLCILSWLSWWGGWSGYIYTMHYYESKPKYFAFFAIFYAFWVDSG
jgi:hypothetical protein